MRYFYYNANPKGIFTEDCTCRSISVAEGITWEQCHKKLSDLSRQEGVILNDAKFIEDYLDDRYSRECHYAKTIGEFAEEYPYGKYAVTTNGHITAIIDGIIYDTFDPSDRIMRCAWRIR